MRVISGFATLGAVLFATSTAFAADPPDLVGTWKGTGDAHAAVILCPIGTPRAEAAASSRPPLPLMPNAPRRRCGGLGARAPMP